MLFRRECLFYLWVSADDGTQRSLTESLGKVQLQERMEGHYSCRPGTVFMENESFILCLTMERENVPFRVFLFACSVSLRDVVTLEDEGLVISMGERWMMGI